MKSSKKLSRRKFIGGLSSAALGSAVALSGVKMRPKAAQDRGKIAGLSGPGKKVLKNVPSQTVITGSGGLPVRPPGLRRK